MVKARKVPLGQIGRVAWRKVKKASSAQAKKEPPGQVKKWEEVENTLKTYVDNLLVGAIVAFATNTPPKGWLLCDGKEYSTQKYSRLQHRLSPGDIHAPNFHVPNLRHRFIIGTANRQSLGNYAKHIHSLKVPFEHDTTENSLHAHTLRIPRHLLKSTASVQVDNGDRDKPLHGEYMVLKYFIRY